MKLVLHSYHLAVIHYLVSS